IRICDTPLTVEGAALLAAYAQALAAELLRDRIERSLLPLYRVYGFNRFQACRFGYDADLVDAQTHRHSRLGDDIAATLARLMPLARSLGSERALKVLAGLVERQENDSRWLRDRYQEVRSYPDVVRMQSARWSGR